MLRWMPRRYHADATADYAAAAIVTITHAALLATP